MAAYGSDLEWPWRSFTACRPFQMQPAEHLCSILHDFNWQLRMQVRPGIWMALTTSKCNYLTPLRFLLFSGLRRLLLFRDQCWDIRQWKIGCQRIKWAIWARVCCFLGLAVALLAGQWTCDSQVAGSSPGWAALRGGLWQVTYTCVPRSVSSRI